MTEQALILAGHGSHRNPDSARPTLAHADTVREQVDVPVKAAFWKEEPSFRGVLRTVDADEAIVVPVFISEGYFTEQILPREFGLGADDRDGSVAVTRCPPVGTHDAMRDVVLGRIARLYGEPDESLGLALIGHGTERNDKSARAVHDHAQRLRESTALGEVNVAFMDESPGVDGVVSRFDTDSVVVVPIFVADGFHTRDEIPELLGLVDEPGEEFTLPTTVDGHTVYYTSAVGTDEAVADVILERAREGGLDPGATPDGPYSDVPVRSEAAQAFEDWLQPVPETGRQFGELTIEARASGYELRHTEDDRANETVSLKDLRETVRFDQHGRYRPFAGERSLPAGWRVSVADTAEVMTAVATVYPTAIEDWYATQTGGVDPVPWSAVASRQTGIYASVDDLDQGTVDRTVGAVCGGCVRCPAWRETDDDGTTIPCLEPCSFLVAAAREFDAHGATADTDSLHSSVDVERGDLTDPANRYRVRYSRQASKPTQR